MEVEGEPVILLQYYCMRFSICFSIMWKGFLCACGLFVGEQGPGVGITALKMPGEKL